MAGKRQTAVVVLRIPQGMLDAIDRLAQAGFVTRAEAMRALMRRQIVADIPSLAVDGSSEDRTIHPPWPPNGRGEEAE